MRRARVAVAVGAALLRDQRLDAALQVEGGGGGEVEEEVVVVVVVVVEDAPSTSASDTTLAFFAGDGAPSPTGTEEPLL